MELDLLSEFDFLKGDERKKRRRRRPRCGYCRFFNKIPDHQLENSPSRWWNMGICWYRQEVLKKNFIVNKYWSPTYNCKFEWKDIYIGE